MSNAIGVLGLSLNIYAPRITTSPGVVIQPAGMWLASYSHELTMYSHTIEAIGGYSTASVTLALPDAYAYDDWLEGGLGRHVVVQDAEGIVWEGFVNQLTYSAGPFAAVLGPLTDLANRVAVIYTPLNTATNPPERGAPAITVYAEDAASIARYGVWEKIISSGELTGAEALQVRDAWLADHAWPRTTKALSAEGADAPLLTVECAGYHHRLDYTFQDLASGTVTAATKVASILDYDSNGLFSSANASIAANAILISRYEDDDALAWSLLQGIARRGDISYRRHLIGVYAGRRVVYAPAPGAVAYHQRLRERGQQVTTPAGHAVPPWRVQAGQWLIFPDFLVGRSAPGADLAQDPRAMFLEAVMYRAPWQLSLQGSPLDSTSERLMAQLGVGGAR